MHRFPLPAAGELRGRRLGHCVQDRDQPCLHLLWATTEEIVSRNYSSSSLVVDDLPRSLRQHDGSELCHRVRRPTSTSGNLGWNDDLETCPESAREGRDGLELRVDFGRE